MQLEDSNYISAGAMRAQKIEDINRCSKDQIVTY